MFNPITLWLIATRLSGWMIASPGFSEINTPVLTRAFLVMWMSVLLIPMVDPVPMPIGSFWELGLIMFTEFMIGAGFGLMLRMIFACVQFGGIMIDSELGYLIAQQLNPFSPATSGIFSRLFLLISILYFWLEDYFRVVIAALHQSFLLVPIGSLTQPVFDIKMFVKLSAGIFVGGLTFAAPIIALMFFVSITIGFLARTVQGINIFAENFILKIVVGLLGVYLFLGLLFRFVRIQMEQIIPLSSRYFEALVPGGGG
jgi:flagellar biosynthesis protein FliR